MEVPGEGVDEGCCEVVRGEVGFKIPRKDVGNLRGNVVKNAVELNWKVTRTKWGGL